jgi:hypothetical protein
MWIVILEVEKRGYKTHAFIRLLGDAYNYNEMTFRVPRFPKKKYSRKMIEDLCYVTGREYKDDLDVEVRVQELTQRKGITDCIITRSK